MKKIGVLIPDYFWSSIPYEGLTMWHELNKQFNCDLLMFKEDIRLNKVFDDKRDKFKFNPELFKAAKPVILESWIDFFNKTKNYNLILSQTHLYPKIRVPHKHFPIKKFKDELNCPILAWDVGGTDVFCSIDFATYICVKGDIWKNWLIKHYDFPEKNVFVTGSPHYDYFLHSDKIHPKEARPISKEEFIRKYELKDYKKYLLITPTNPSSHKEQFLENFKKLKAIAKFASQRRIKMLIKTYPHDYVYHERSGFYTGIYHRIFDRTISREPQYEFIKNHVPIATILESQDHFAALMYCDKLFNMSGSHIAWETYFTDCQSYSMNYKDKVYYAGASYLSKKIVLPDDEVNIEIKGLMEIFNSKKTNSKNCDKFISKEFAHENICNVIKEIL